MRFTAKGDTVYAILLGTPPGASVTLEGFAPAGGARVELLGRGAVAWQADGPDCRIDLGAPLPGAVAHAFSISRV